MIHPLAAAALTAGVLVVWTAALALNVSRLRIRDRVGVATKETPAHIHRAVRAHGNAAEHVPILLAGVFAMAVEDFDGRWVLAAGIAAIVSRIAHGVGMLTDIKVIRIRFYATILTYSTMFVTGIAATVSAVLNVCR